MLTRLTQLGSMALVFTGLMGCSADKNDAAPSFETDPKVLKSALEDPIVSCQTTFGECRDSATDADARGLCNDDLAACLRDAATRATETAEALTACRDEANECVRDGGDVDDCRTTYESCSEAAVDGTDSEPSDAGSDDSDAGDVDTSLDGGTPDLLPGLPTPSNGLDSGVLDNLPTPVKCIIELRLCVSLDLSSGAAACADEARICLDL